MGRLPLFLELKDKCEKKKPEARATMSYSTTAHALISYVECHLNNFDLKEMSNSFGFSEIYLRELFLRM